MNQIHLMSTDDIEMGLDLCRQAGWNQTRTDWLRFLALQPDGCFIAERNGVPIGTVTTCVFGSVAWIGMMLVEASHRGQGIGRALMEHAVGLVEQSGVSCIRLDATNLGMPLYEKLGFVEQSRWIRYGGVPITSLGHASGVRRLVDRDRLFRHDQSAVTYDRRRLLRTLLAEETVMAFEFRDDDDSASFIFERPGAIARFVGPCLAESSKSGRAVLIDRLGSADAQPTFVDVPIENQSAVDTVISAGLTPLREFIRMARGDRIFEDLHRVWASSGPEMG